MLNNSYKLSVESAYIITLFKHGESERLSERCANSCREVGMPFKKSPAIDGTKGSLNIPDQWSSNQPLHWLRQTDTRLSVTEVACALSHFVLWCHCLSLDQPIVILEHDTIMVQPYYEHPVYNGLVYLGGKEQKTMGWPVLTIPPHASNGPNYHFMCRAHAYAIDPAMARRLVAHLIQKGIHEALDVMLNADIFTIIQQGLYAYDLPSEVNTIVNRKQY